MDLILHIGTEKTGSTSFQWWGGQNRTLLRENGIFYGRALGERNHQLLYLWALDEFGKDEGFGRTGITDLAGYDRLQIQVPTDLAAEIATARDAGCHSYVLSCEHCHSRLVRPEQVQRLHDMLAPLFDRMQVICALRPQIDMGMSLLSTAARGFSPITRKSMNQIRPHNLYFNFEALNGRWSAAFGSDNVHFIAYRRGQSMVDHVVQRFALTPDVFETPPRTNSAFDARTFGIINTLANLTPEQQRALRPVLNPVLENLPVTTPLRPDLALAQEIQGRFDEQNARLIDRRPELEPGDLDPYWDQYPETGNLDTLEATAPYDDQVALLLHTLCRNLVMMDLRRTLADAERLIAEGHPDRAKRLLPNIQRLSNRFDSFGAARPEKLDRRIDRIKDAVVG